MIKELKLYAIMGFRSDGTVTGILAIQQTEGRPHPCVCWDPVLAHGMLAEIEHGLARSSKFVKEDGIATAAIIEFESVREIKRVSVIKE